MGTKTKSKYLQTVSVPQKDHAEAGCGAILDDLEDPSKTILFSDKTSSELEAFKLRHKERLNMAPDLQEHSFNGDNGEILHHMAANIKFSKAHGREFTRRAISNYRPLLLCTSDAHLTPLQKALTVGNHEFVEQVLQESKEVHQIIERDIHDSNCLHLAIANQSPMTEPIIDTLIVPQPNEPAEALDVDSDAELDFHVFPPDSREEEPGRKKAFLQGSTESTFLSITETNGFKVQQFRVQKYTPLHLAVLVHPREWQKNWDLDQEGQANEELEGENTPERTEKAAGSRGVEIPTKVEGEEGFEQDQDQAVGGAAHGRGSEEEAGNMDDDEDEEGYDPGSRNGESEEEPDYGWYDQEAVVRKLIKAVPVALFRKDMLDHTPFQLRLCGIMVHRRNIQREAGQVGKESQGGIHYCPLDDNESYDEQVKLINRDGVLRYIRKFVISRFGRRRAMEALYQVTGGASTDPSPFSLCYIYQPSHLPLIAAQGRMIRATTYLTLTSSSNRTSGGVRPLRTSLHLDQLGLPHGPPSSPSVRRSSNTSSFHD